MKAPIQTYTKSELTQIYKVSRIKLMDMLKQVPGLSLTQDSKRHKKKKTYRKIFLPSEVEMIFNKWGAPDINS